MDVHKSKQSLAFYSPDMAYPWGGSEVLWSSAAKRIAQSGQKVTACVQGWGAKESPAIEQLRTAGITVSTRPEVSRSRHSIPQRVRSKLFPPSRFTKRWVEENEDALTVVSLPINVATADTLFTQECWPKKYVLIVQAAFDFSWPKGEQREKLQKIYSKACRVFFVSRHNQNLTEAQLGLRLPQAQVIYNPFQVLEDSPIQFPPTPDPLKIACVARLATGVKGHDLLLRALARPQWKSRQVELSLVGSGPDESVLQQLTEMLELNNVTFCSQVHDIGKVWESHHMGILTSRGEGMPLSVLEGMGCGRAFVVTGGTWAEELIDDGIDGFIAAETTVDGVCSALERAWQQREELGEIGKAALTKIMNRVPADPVQELINKLLELCT